MKRPTLLAALACAATALCFAASAQGQGLSFPPKADEACLNEAIATSANVTTSYGKSYRVETWYRTPGEVAVNFDNDKPNFMAIEGPLAWTRDAAKATLVGDKEKRIIVGHQFHALAFRFDEIFYDVKPVRNVSFRGEKHAGRKGLIPGGGATTLVVGDDESRPLGLIIEQPGAKPLEVTYDDWRETPSGRFAPWRVVIKENEKTFDYSYTDIVFDDHDAVDYQERYAAPAIDEVAVFRLHRALLAAHCRGDAAMMAALTAPEGVVASRGDLLDVSRADTHQQFQAVFARSFYASYADIQPPVIAVSKGGDVGWVVVNVRPEGTMLKTGEPFAGQWAWAILARKIDGVWLSVGNISNAREE